MIKPMGKAGLVLGIIFLLIATSVVSSKNMQSKPADTIFDTQLADQNLDSDAIVANKQIKTKNGQLNMFKARSEDQKPSETDKTTSNKPNWGEQELPAIVNEEKTFVISMYYQFLRDKFVVSLDDFTWEQESNRYTYDQGEETYEFHRGLYVFATLSELTICFDFDVPYRISYSYEVQTNPLQFAPFGDFINCRVFCSPVQVESGLYTATETYNGESVYESYEDYDGTVIKRALNYVEGDLTKSMAYFKVNSDQYAEEDYVYQRGLNYMSAIIGDGKTPTGGASIYCYAQTLGFDITGEMDKFWIESGWEGTIGDKYTSNQKFRIELQ